MPEAFCFSGKAYKYLMEYSRTSQMPTNTCVWEAKLSFEVVQILIWGSVSSVLSLSAFSLKFDPMNLGAGKRWLLNSLNACVTWPGWKPKKVTWVLSVNPRVHVWVKLGLNLTSLSLQHHYGTDSSGATPEKFNLYNFPKPCKAWARQVSPKVEYTLVPDQTSRKKRGTLAKRTEQIKINWATDAGLTFVQSSSSTALPWQSSPSPFWPPLLGQAVTLGDPAHFTPWPNYIQRGRGWNMTTVHIFIIGGSTRSDHLGWLK